MSDDIVKRLRAEGIQELHDAADEIEKLRATIAALLAIPDDLTDYGFTALDLRARMAVVEGEQ